MGYPCPPIVSLQRTAAGSARDRHVSWAALVDADTVVAPVPAKDLADPDARLEVLITSTLPEQVPPGAGQAAVARVAERVPVEHVRLVRLAGHEGLAALTLAAPSRHWPYSRPFEAAELARSIAATPTLWAALEHLGLLPPGLPDRPLEALDAVVAFERAQAAESVEEVAFDSEEELAAFGCCWLLRICCKSADVVAGGPVALPTPTARR